MIIPSSILNKFEERFFVWIKGANRSGKTSLAFHIAEMYISQRFRLMSNTDSPWNDDFTVELLDTNGMLNCIVVLDEGGVYMRTKESIREVMGFKGVLNALFLMPSTEEPHEDLWSHYIEPASGINWILSFLFGRWFVDHVIKVWRFVEFDPKKMDKKTIFFELFPSRAWGFYTTITKHSPEFILQTFRDAFQAQQEFFGNSDPLQLHDLVTKKRGLSEGASFLSNQMANARSLQGERSFLSTKTKRK